MVLTFILTMGKIITNMRKVILIFLVVFASLISSGQMFYGHNQFTDDSETLGYGLLYNWYAASDANFAPTDWKVPERADYDALIAELGGSSIAGGKMKESGLNHWNTPNSGADNSSQFNALGSGIRDENGTFSQLKEYLHLFINNLSGSTYYVRKPTYFNAQCVEFTSVLKSGTSVRLIYTGLGTPTTVTDYDGNVYSVVLIGTQYWTASNWKCKHLNNGDAIPEVTDNATWAGLTTGAWCYYDNDPTYE